MGVFKKLKKTGSLFIVISDCFQNGKQCLVIEKLILEMDRNGWALNQKIFWQKEDGNPLDDSSKRLLPSYEYILYFVKVKKHFSFSIRLR